MDFKVERTDDPRAAEELERGEGWTRAPGEVARRFAPEGAGHFVARDPAGDLLGAVSCATYGPAPGGEPLAWVGGMVVRPGARGRGVGRALLRAALAHAEARGARVVGLDATPEGRALYEAEGFRPVGETARWARAPGEARPAPEVPGPCSLIPVSFSELLEVSDYDAPRFGASRAPLIADLLARFPGRGFLAYDRRSGACAGFVLGTDRFVGPLVADSPEVAARLLFACEQAGTPPVVHLLGLNPAAEGVFKAAGYAPDGAKCTRMVRGGDGEHPGEPEAVYAIASWQLG